MLIVHHKDILNNFCFENFAESSRQFLIQKTPGVSKWLLITYPFLCGSFPIIFNDFMACFLSEDAHFTITSALPYTKPIIKHYVSNKRLVSRGYHRKKLESDSLGEMLFTLQVLNSNLSSIDIRIKWLCVCESICGLIIIFYGDAR